MNKVVKIVLSFPKTLFFNFRYLSFKKAIKLPIWLSYNTIIKVKGKISLAAPPHFAMIRIGFHMVPVCDRKDQTLLEIEKYGVLVFEGSAHIGNGSKLFIGKNATLVLGNNFAISSSSSVLCYKRIVFGEDVQLSWDCLLMDSDTHTIYDDKNKVINEPKEIIVGNKIWIGARCMVLKGTVIPNNCVIGACSLVNGNKFTPNSIIVGSPAKSVKDIGGFII